MSGKVETFLLACQSTKPTAEMDPLSLSLGAKFETTDNGDRDNNGVVCGHVTGSYSSNGGEAGPLRLLIAAFAG